MKTITSLIICVLLCNICFGIPKDHAFIYSVSTSASDADIINAFKLADDKQWELYNWYSPPGTSGVFSDGTFWGAALWWGGPTVYKTTDASSYYVVVVAPTPTMQPPSGGSVYSTQDPYYAIDGWANTLTLTAAYNGGSLTQSATFLTHVPVTLADGAIPPFEEIFYNAPSSFVSGLPVGRVSQSFAAAYIKAVDSNPLSIYERGNYWAPSEGGGGSGTWGSDTDVWSWGEDYSQRDLPQALIGPLIFSNTPGKVTVNGSVTPWSGMHFAADGYTVEGGTIMLYGNSVANTIWTDTGVGATINSHIDGSVGLSKNGSGALTLAGDNSFTGGTIISDGTLRVGNGDTSGSLGTGSVTNNGILEFNRSDSVIVSNRISGTGTFIKHGSGTVALIRGNNYTGTTTINEGTLQIGDETAFGSTGRGDVINNATLDIKRSNTFIFSNTISGSGQIRQIGSGSTIMTGNNNYTGSTLVNNGSLIVDGSVTSSTFTSRGNGILGGSGIIGAASIEDGGKLAPGNSIGTLRTGTLTFYENSELAIELDSLDMGSDLVVVAGSLSLEGIVSLTLKDVSESSVPFAIDTTFSILNYSGVWNGGLFTYGAMHLDNGATFSAGLNHWRIVYDASIGGHNVAANNQLGASFINITAVPEPSTYALLLMTGAGALWWARHRKDSTFHLFVARSVPFLSKLSDVLIKKWPGFMKL